MTDRQDQPIVVVEKQGTSMGAFLFGAALGAVAGVLFAPRSGEETRRELEEGADKVRQDAEEKLTELRQEVEQAYDRAREEMKARLQGARSELEGRGKQAEDVYRAGRDAAREAREELQHRMDEAKAARRAELGEESEEVMAEEEA